MRRVWLLVLALLLPLQMTWAAVHGYAHDADASAHVHAEVQAKVDAATDLDLAPDQQADAKGHGCCDMAHSCHGTATMVPTPVLQLTIASRSPLNSSPRALMPQELVTRHERPQWAAA